jgi:hypothetical protein
VRELRRVTVSDRVKLKNQVLKDKPCERAEP